MRDRGSPAPSQERLQQVIYGAEIGFLYYIALMSLLPDRGSDLGDIGLACVEAEFGRMTLRWP
jgi:hypothetical protein